MNSTALSASTKAFYTRQAQTVFLRYASLYPALMINGPRQSGKTTLAISTFPHLPYVSLENVEVQLSFKEDPRGFLSHYKTGAIFDEVQHTPELLSYLQEIIDFSDETGRFVITGSQNFVLSRAISQSLAGRIGQITLLPLSSHEMTTQQGSSQLILNGGYPRLYKYKMQAFEFYPSYITTYVQQDVRDILNVQNLQLFRKFLGLCAGRVGQLLNSSDLARDCGIAPSTAVQWLSILETSYIIFFLRPYHTNFNKRLTKMPKLYFYDTGLAASLLEIKTPEQVAQHFARGSLFENLIILEALKARLNQGHEPHLYFWRDSTGREVDLIEEWAGTTRAFEIKASQTARQEDGENLRYLAKLMPAMKSHIVYDAPQLATMAGIELITISDIASILEWQS